MNGTERIQRRAEALRIGKEAGANGLFESLRTAENIAFLRKQGLAVGDVADILGVSRWTVWVWQRERRRPKEAYLRMALSSWVRELKALETPKQKP